MYRFSFLLPIVFSHLFSQDLDSKNIEISEQDLDNIKKLANPYDIDYNTLDTKYYKYIKSFNAIYDSDIKRLVRNVHIGLDKSGIFISTQYGGNINKFGVNPTLLGLQVGYDNFKGLVLPPALMGYSMYIDYIHSFLANNINLASVNIDLAIQKDFNASFSAGFSLGAGFGIGDVGVKYGFAGRINYSIDFRFIRKNTLRLMINAIRI